MSFDADIDRFRAECMTGTERRFRRVAMVVLEKLVRRTPVDTGCARANWNVAIDRHNYSTDLSNTANQAITNGSPTIMQARIGQDIFITNAVPYITYLERGRSVQQPEGFLLVTESEIQDLLNRGLL